MEEIFEEIDPKLADDYKLVRLNERENCIKQIFSWVREFSIRTNYNGDIEYFFSFNSLSDKKELLEKNQYELKIIQNPITKEIEIEHNTCPDYNINRLCQSQCKHIIFARKIMEIYNENKKNKIV